jgi:hypothetical protein
MPGVIRGAVRGPDGSAIAQARVYFTSAPVRLPDIAALTNERGEFSLTAPVAGDYGVEAAADGFDSEAVVVNASDQGEAQVEIRLIPSR